MNPQALYGPVANTVYAAYCKVNPLGMEDLKKTNYWTHVSSFLYNLHSVLYLQGHQMNIKTITADKYYFLVKMCVDSSFVVADLINIRNQKENKVCKILANEIAHHIMPPYLTMLNQLDPPLYAPNPFGSFGSFVPAVPTVPAQAWESGASAVPGTLSFTSVLDMALA